MVDLILNTIIKYGRSTINIYSIIAMLETILFIVGCYGTDFLYAHRFHIIFYNIICLLLCGTIMWQKRVTISWLNLLKALFCFFLMHLALIAIDKVLVVIELLVMFLIYQVLELLGVSVMSDYEGVLMGAFTVYLKVAIGGYLFIWLLNKFRIEYKENSNVI